MIPAERLLEKLNELPRHSGGRQSFVHTDPATGSGVTVEFDLLEGLAAQIWSVDAQVGCPPAMALADRAQELARRVTGLLEPLQVVEVDAGLGRALLRSAQPAAKAQERHYHELLLDAQGRATLRRYQGSMAVSGRRQISFTLTRDALAKTSGRSDQLTRRQQIPPRAVLCFTPGKETRRKSKNDGRLSYPP